jgi:RHS repeat-associated protein
VPLLDTYLQFLAVRSRPNTVAAVAYDLKVFFTVVGKPPGCVDPPNHPVRSPNPAGQDTLVTRAQDGVPLSDKTGTAAARSLIVDGVHGDVAAGTNPTTGDVSASATYRPYGGTTAATGILPLGYQGGWTDPATAQVNAHARWITPATGGFTSRDTWTLPPTPTPRTNRYLYGEGDPVSNADISGHCQDPDPFYCIIEGAGHLIHEIWEFYEGSPAGDGCYGPDGLIPGSVCDPDSFPVRPGDTGIPAYCQYNPRSCGLGPSTRAEPPGGDDGTPGGDDGGTRPCTGLCRIRHGDAFLRIRRLGVRVPSGAPS